MAAARIKDGVNDSGRRALFAGKKFFLLQRVPLRYHLRAMIEGHGGELVKLEKLADYIIADHARKDCPAGSISWTFIEESTNRGVLQKVEDHRAGPSVQSIREVGSGQPTRYGRIPFTEDDDKILFEWCRKAERDGLPLKGNQIYAQLEEVNGRHTAQSWRDRWIRKVSNYPRPSSTGQSENHGSPRPTRLKRRQMYSDASPPASPRLFVANLNENRAFTQEETDLLLDQYDDIMNLAKDRVIEAWIAFANNYPSHTAQEWHNHFHEHVIPLFRAKRSQKTYLTPRKMSPVEVSKRTDERNSGRSEALPLSDLSPAEPQTKYMDPTLQDEALFRECLLSLANELEFDVQLSASICGREIQLFELWQIVQSPKFGGFDEVTAKELWAEVARTLNFDVYQHNSAPNDLRDCYSEILADFEQTRKDYLTERLSMVEDEIDNRGDTPVDEKNGLLADEYNVDSPQVMPERKSSSSKRGSGIGHESRDSGYNKRQRIDKGKGKIREIPSTPEHVIRGNELSHPAYRLSPISYPFPLIPEPNDKVFSELTLNPTTPNQILRPESRDLSVGQDPDSEMNPKQDLGLKRMMAAEDDPVHVTSASRSLRSQASSPRVSNSTVHTARQVNRTKFSNQDDYSAHSQTTCNWEPELKTNDNGIQDFVHQQVEDQGYPQEIVIDALLSTTMEIGPLFEKVTNSLLNGDGIPDDIPGVWTKADDVALDAAVGSKEHSDILTKHSKKRIQNRRLFQTWKTEAEFAKMTREAEATVESE